MREEKMVLIPPKINFQHNLGAHLLFFSPYMSSHELNIYQTLGMEKDMQTKIPDECNTRICCGD